MRLGIIGAGEQANEILSLIKNDNYFMNQYEDCVLVDLDADSKNGIISELEFFKRPIEDYSVIVAMGEPSMRAKMKKKYMECGYRFATYIHKSSVVGMNTVVSSGSIILPFVYIAQNTVIGENTLVHAGARIENDCVVGDDCMISSGAFIGAKTQIGNATFVGPNASVKDGLLIGDNAVIGMGSCVIKDIADEDVVVGNPARYIRHNSSRRVFS